MVQKQTRRGWRGEGEAGADRGEGTEIGWVEDRHRTLMPGLTRGRNSTGRHPCPENLHSGQETDKRRAGPS